jgi:predicted nucleic acid-binding protein
MIVVDTGIIACMTFATPCSAVVGTLHEKDPVWEVPLFWKNEFLNVLAMYQRKGLLNYEESLEALDFAERLVGFREHTMPVKAVIDAVINSNCSSYDCEFIVLAEKLGTKLITYQKRLIDDFPAIAVTPEVFLEHRP